MTHEKRIEIRWRDLDALRHVNNAVYATYLEEARDEWFVRALGPGGNFWDYVLARVAIDFRRELTQDDEALVVRTRLVRIGTSSLTFREEIVSLAGWVAAEAESVVVARDRDTGRSRPFTDAERADLSGRPRGRLTRYVPIVGERPIIGITSYAQPARWGAWELKAALVPYDYVESVERAGGRALVVPPSVDGVDETLDVLDGVVFSGGIDIDPDTYGADRDEKTDPAQAHRDAGEMALLRRALERDVPTLAICRGFQLLNVVRGGDLVQHLPDTVGHEGHREVLGAFSEHAVEVKSGTRLSEIIGARHDGVQSSHHQGVGSVGEGLVETAWAEDGSLEGLEDPDRRFAVGVLWHPEMEEDKRLFEALVAEARRYRAERTALGSR